MGILKGHKHIFSFYIMTIGGHWRDRSEKQWVHRALKIGYSSNIERRIGELKSQYRSDITLLFRLDNLNLPQAVKMEERNRKIFRRQFTPISQDRFIIPHEELEIKVERRSRRIEKWVLKI